VKVFRRNGQGGNTSLTLFDQSTTTPKGYEIYANVVKRVVNPGIVPFVYDAVVNYANVQSLPLNGGSNGDIYWINGTAAATSTTVNGGGGIAVFVCHAVRLRHGDDAKSIRLLCRTGRADRCTAPTSACGL